MNKKQLMQLGVPEDCVAEAIACVQAAATQRKVARINSKKLIPQIVSAPDVYQTDEFFAPLASALIEYRRESEYEQDPCDLSQLGR